MVASSWLELNINLGLSICFCSETSLESSISASEALAVPLLQVVADFLCCFLLFFYSSIFIISQHPLNQSTLPPCHFLLKCSPDYSIWALCTNDQYFPHSFLFLPLEIPGLPFSLLEHGHFQVPYPSWGLDKLMLASCLILELCYLLLFSLIVFSTP